MTLIIGIQGTATTDQTMTCTNIAKAADYIRAPKDCEVSERVSTIYFKKSSPLLKMLSRNSFIKSSSHKLLGKANSTLSLHRIRITIRSMTRLS